MSRLDKVLLGVSLWVFGYLTGAALLGGTEVLEVAHPAESCREDEVYWWVGEDTRKCVPADNIARPPAAELYTVEHHKNGLGIRVDCDLEHVWCDNEGDNNG